MESKPHVVFRRLERQAPVEGSHLRVLVSMANPLVAEALESFLRSHGYDTDAAGWDGLEPEVMMVDQAVLRTLDRTREGNTRILLLELERHSDIGSPMGFVINHKIHGVIAQESNFHDLRTAINAVAEGRVWLKDATVKGSLSECGLISGKGWIKALTEREIQIMGHISQGFSNKEIAVKLGISSYTVKSHIHNILRKCGATSRSRLASLVTFLETHLGTVESESMDHTSALSC